MHCATLCFNVVTNTFVIFFNNTDTPILYNIKSNYLLFLCNMQGEGTTSKLEKTG